jgi:hypothetical protein
MSQGISKNKMLARKTHNNEEQAFHFSKDKSECLVFQNVLCFFFPLFSHYTPWVSCGYLTCIMGKRNG